MSIEQQEKVRPTHLSRPAYLYVRQSTLKQVFENTESKLRQYDLRSRAIALGWPADSVVVIDSDQGHSGASAADRRGFQRLVTDVGLGRVGLVMGLEVSRLARKSSDWHRLVEICGLAETLILDEDGLYDPNSFNDRLRARNVQQAQYESDAARHRFMQVDPDNRLVADELEADWNRKLRELREAQAEYERLREQDRAELSETRRQAVFRLATDFPAVWNSPQTPAREKKRLLRLLVEDVTIIRNDEVVTAHVRLRGGATRTLTVRLRKSGFLEHQTDPALVAEYDRLLDEHDDERIADILNRRGFRSGHGHRVTEGLLKSMRARYRLRSHYARLRDRGLLNKQELAAHLGVSPSTISNWTREGRIEAVPSKKRGLTLYKTPTSSRLTKYSRTSNHRVSTQS